MVVNSKPVYQRFERELRRALGALYDPSSLRASPLAKVFGVDGSHDPVEALRRVILDSIESLRPGPGSPSRSASWRVYQVLRRRYIEQLTQRRVAKDLGMSLRQVQREDKRARQELLEHLWTVHKLGDRLAEVSAAMVAADAPEPHYGPAVPTRDQELEWLGRSIASELTDVNDAIQDVLLTVAPLAQSEDVSMSHDLPGDSLCIEVPQTVLRQALVHALTTVIPPSAGGRVSVEAQAGLEQVTIRIRARAPEGSRPVLPNTHQDRLDMASRVIALAGGTLEVSPATTAEASLTVSMTLQRSRYHSVLVIDDNADTRRLFQRYLSGTVYRFIGTRDPEEALSLAQTLAPQLIVVDVMMPGVDGWKLMAHLHEHPDTRDIPIVVCTILSEEELALALGASEFIRKPVTREAFLAMLERHITPTTRQLT